MTQKPWETEPDLVRFTHKGVKCIILRHPTMGHLCGYVRLRRGNRLYDEVKKIMAKRECHDWNKRSRSRGCGYYHRSLLGIDVHGGMTFCGEQGLARGLWVGFDCAHYTDLSPGLLPMSAAFRSTLCDYAVYRDIAYVKAETCRMAEQLQQLVNSATK